MQRDIERTQRFLGDYEPAIRLAQDADQFYWDHESQFRQAQEATSAIQAARQLASAGAWLVPPLPRPGRR